MVSVLDVAKFILKQKGGMSAMKLQKLVYYCQAWSLVWDDRPLFREKIKAWANGPVVPALYQAHKGLFQVEARQVGGHPDALHGESRDTVIAVLGFYGDKTGQWLSELTHQERPWADARKGLASGERGSVEITHAAMAEYYGSLLRPTT
jgi:uncharacterized phage-associated protein